jgi:hypothetical protein
VSGAASGKVSGEHEMKDSEPAGSRDEQKPKKWVDKTWVQLIGVAGAIILFVVVAWFMLDWYIDPDPENSKAKRELVQALALLTAGVAGAFGIYFTWRGQRITREGLERAQKDTAQQLHLTQQGQITERFTRAIEQLGATNDRGENKLEIRLGGIYALERIAWDSPERDYSTVIEVLTAYVRENTTQALGSSEGSSDEASPLHPLRRWLRSAAKADKVAKQPAPLEPTADIEAILDVLRRTQARVPGKDHTSLDLHEANLMGANLNKANLVGANLLGANLQVADLTAANLQGAEVTDEQLADTRSLEGATMPNGQKYEDWLKDQESSGKDVENE